jgi:hypothetical protein
MSPLTGTTAKRCLAGAAIALALVGGAGIGAPRAGAWSEQVIDTRLDTRLDATEAEPSTDRCAVYDPIPRVWIHVPCLPLEDPREG